MIVVLSYIKLKTPFHFFKLSRYALSVNLQLKKTSCLGYKKQGLGIHHYIMTLWKNEEDMKQFSYSDAHLKAIKVSSTIAQEIRTLQINSSKLPKWKTAKQLLEKGKVITYN